MIYFIPAQVPAPGVFIVANQGLQMRGMLLVSLNPPGISYLIAHGVKGSVLCGHAHHCMGPSLPGGPAQLEYVKSSLVTNLNTAERELVVGGDL